MLIPLLLSLAAQAATPSELLAKLPLDGWRITGTKEGDLNKDGLPDVAASLRRPSQKGEDDDILLRVYFATKEGGLRLAAEAPKALCAGCGGLKGGDEPVSIEIKGGVLSLEYFGGSRDWTSLATKWRWEKETFHLIGFTDTYGDNYASEPGQIFESVADVNLVTGKRIDKDKVVEGKTGQRSEEEDPIYFDSANTVTKTGSCSVATTARKMTIEEFDVMEEGFRNRAICKSISKPKRAGTKKK